MQQYGTYSQGKSWSHSIYSFFGANLHIIEPQFLVQSHANDFSPLPNLLGYLGSKLKALGTYSFWYTIPAGLL